MTIKKPMVADIMTTRASVPTVDAALDEADVVLRSTFLKGLPVVDRPGVLVGVGSNADLVAYRFGHLRTPVAATRTRSASAR